MKKLFYSVSSLHNPHVGVMLNKILSDKRKGVEVVMAYCDRALPSCIGNVNGNKGICRFCRHMHHQMAHDFLPGVETIAVSGKKFKKSEARFHYEDIYELKKITYRQVDIGLSVLSYWVTITRIPTGKITAARRAYFDQLLSALCSFVDYAYDLVDQVQPDVITIYNGRLFENHLFYDIAEAKGIKFESLEVMWRIGMPSVRIEHEGGLPLDIRKLTSACDELWSKSSRTEEQKIEVGSSFFYNRRNGKPTNDFIYTGRQVKDLLPEGFDPQKRNFVIFNSSEDEIISLGGEWDEGNLFETQLDAIRFVLDHLPPDTHVYLRIHPNLKGLKAAYHTDLYKLESEHLTVIPPESPISSYALMDHAEKMLVMGSTMGVESCFWGKPVIILHKAEYYYLNVGYTPQTRDELVRLLHDELTPKSKDGALKYGYYYMAVDERKQADDTFNINAYKAHFLGKEIDEVFEHQRLLGSSTLYRLFYPRYQKYCTKFSKNTVAFPE